MSGKSADGTEYRSSPAIAVARWCPRAVMALGGLVLLGWVLDIGTLKSIHPAFASMKANTAVCFLLAGVALFPNCAPTPPARLRRAFSVTSAGIVTATGAATLGQYTLGWDPGIDELLFRDMNPVATSSPGRMSGIAAFTLAILGVGLIAQRAHPRFGRQLAASFSVLALALSLIALVGYAYGVDSLYAFSGFTATALHTAAGTAVLSIGILLAPPGEPFSATLFGPSQSAAIARRLLPAVVIVPLSLGWLRVMGQRAGRSRRKGVSGGTLPPARGDGMFVATPEGAASDAGPS